MTGPSVNVGDYEILSTLGKGGMGVVYRARALNGRIVAVKVLLELTGDKRARFERERRLLDQLGESQGFIPLLDAGDTGREPFIVMPFVGGGTLRDRLERGPLGVEETARLGKELARARAHAHALGIIHHDLKPENILYNEAGRALVADLGLAKHYDVEALGASLSVSMSKSGMWRGTPGYMAPEQMKDAKTCGPEADVFALGAILHECLAGERAFDGEGIVEVLEKSEKGDRPSLRRARPEAHPSLVAAIDKALHPNPRRRFPDCAAFARALDKDFVAPRRSLALPLVGGVLLLGLAGAGGAFLWTSGPPRPVPPVAPPPPGPNQATAATPGSSAAALKTARRTELLDKGANALALGKLDDSIAYASAAIELDPLDAVAWQMRGVAKGSKGDPEGAIEDLNRAIELDADAPTFGARALAHNHLGQFDAAIDDYGRALDLTPNNPHMRHNRGELLFRKGRFDDALVDLTECVRLDPTFADGWFLLGATRDKQGDLEGAMACFERSIKSGTARSIENAWRAFVDVQHRLSTLLDQAGEQALNRKEYDLAIALCTKALALNPKNTTAYIDRGVAFSDKGCHDLAIADYTAAVEINPKLCEAFSNRGAARNKKNDLEGALADYAKSIEIRPEFGPAYINRSIVYEKMGDDEKAVADLKRFLEVDPKSGYVRTVKGRIAFLESRIATKR